jgi:hypothetical protein
MHGVRSQREIDFSKQSSLPGPSPGTEYKHWSTVQTLLNRLDFEAERLAIFGDRLHEYLAQGTVDEAEWRAIEPRLRREHDRQEFLERKRKIQAAIREKLLSSFIQEHVPIEFDFQKGLLKRRIEMLLWEGKEESLQAYLTDVLELGLEKADKKQKREQRKGGYALYTWSVLVGTIKVGIVLGAFSVSKTKFETVAIALIILTYQMVEGYFGDLGISTLLTKDESRLASKRIRRLLKEEMPEEVAQREMEEERILEKASHRTMVLTLIQAGFSLVIFSITFFELIFEGIF